MGKTKIPYATVVWNPVSGCDKVSLGCSRCYALAMAARLKAAGVKGYQRDGDPRTSGPGFGVTLHPEKLEEPLRWRKPQRIFVNSMSDLFHEQVPASFIWQVYEVMHQAQHHSFLVLTKRIERAKMIYDTILRGVHSLPNVWLGVSAENQHWADIRYKHLRQIPAAVRFLSAEPLLSAIDLRPWLGFICGHEPVSGNYARCEICSEGAKGLDQVIIGGESGPGFRPMRMEWARDLIAQCQAAGVSCFVKQDSGLRPGMQGRFTPEEWRLKQFPHAMP